jgi:hypothetical protein
MTVGTVLKLLFQHNDLISALRQLLVYNNKALYRFPDNHLAMYNQFV